MCRNIIKRSNHAVTVFDLNPAAVKTCTDLGATAAKSVAEATKGADIVMTSLPMPRDVEAVTLGDNGIRVDRHMQTSDGDIFAVGDVADLKGTPRGLWPIGAAHASTAVEAMLGAPVPYATPRIVLQVKRDKSGGGCG